MTKRTHPGPPVSREGAITAYLGLGTNLGNKEQNIKVACELLEDKAGHITKCSSLFYSEPWGFESENTFVNVVVEVETELTPHELLAATQSVEREMGRTEKSVNGVYHDRIIDIDILLYGFDKSTRRSVQVNDHDLVIPHPLMKERDFVMTPLNEILKH